MLHHIKLLLLLLLLRHQQFSSHIHFNFVTFSKLILIEYNLFDTGIRINTEHLHKYNSEKNKYIFY
jgi:hypothetical protein